MRTTAGSCGTAAFRAGICVNAAAITLAVGAGCAATPPGEREASEYERIDDELSAADRFEELARACRASGGVVYVDRTTRLPNLSAIDMKSAGCSMPASRR